MIQHDASSPCLQLMITGMNAAIGVDMKPFGGATRIGFDHSVQLDGTCLGHKDSGRHPAIVGHNHAVIILMKDMNLLAIKNIAVLAKEKSLGALTGDSGRRKDKDIVQLFRAEVDAYPLSGAKAPKHLGIALLLNQLELVFKADQKMEGAGFRVD